MFIPIQERGAIKHHREQELHIYINTTKMAEYQKDVDYADVDE